MSGIALLSKRFGLPNVKTSSATPLRYWLARRVLRGSTAAAALSIRPRRNMTEFSTCPTTDVSYRAGREQPVLGHLIKPPLLDCAAAGGRLAFLVLGGIGSTCEREREGRLDVSSDFWAFGLRLGTIGRGRGHLPGDSRSSCRGALAFDGAESFRSRSDILGRRCARAENPRSLELPGWLLVPAWSHPSERIAADSSGPREWATTPPYAFAPYIRVIRDAPVAPAGKDLYLGHVELIFIAQVYGPRGVETQPGYGRLHYARQLRPRRPRPRFLPR